MSLSLGSNGSYEVRADDDVVAARTDAPPPRRAQRQVVHKVASYVVPGCSMLIKIIRAVPDFMGAVAAQVMEMPRRHENRRVRSKFMKTFDFRTFPHPRRERLPSRG